MRNTHAKQLIHKPPTVPLALPTSALSIFIGGARGGCQVGPRCCLCLKFEKMHSVLVRRRLPAVRGISEENFKPSRVNRCLVLWLLTLEKPRFPSEACGGAGDGEKTHGCETGTGSGTQCPWAQGRTDSQTGGAWGESPFALQCKLYLFIPPINS